MKKYAWVAPTLYIIFLMLPIYWLLNMSFKTTNEILGTFTLWPQNFTFDNYIKIFTDPDLVQRLHQLHHLRRDEHRAVGFRCVAGGLCIFTLSVPRRQTSVFLAADQPHGAPRGVRPALLSALLGNVGLFDTHHRGRPGPLPVQHSPGGVDTSKASCPEMPKELDETAYLDGYSFWRFFIRRFSFPTIAAGIGVAAFFCFMYSWVELLLAKTLTSVAAKPIAATMTRTASTVGV